MDRQPPTEEDDLRAAARARDRDLVERVRAGEGDAFGQLYDLWFDRVFDLVSRIVRNADIAAEVSQDTFLSAWRTLDGLENPDALGGWLLRIARNAAYNRSTKEQRSRAIDGQELTMIEATGAGASNAPVGFGVEDRLGRAATPGVALEDGEAASLVWEAASALPDRDLEVLDLQLRHGLTPAEIGEMLGMNRNAANQLVHRLRGRLEVAIRARVLWRRGEPVCVALSQLLANAGVTRFDATAVRVIERHVPDCDECAERQRLRLQPSVLFASLPIMVAPMLVKQQSAYALASAGVPMQGSTCVAASGAPLSAAASASSGSSGSSGGLGSPGSEPWGSGPPTGPTAPTEPASMAESAGGSASDELAARRLSRGRLVAMLSAAALLVLLLGLGFFALRADRAADEVLDVAASSGPVSSATTTDMAPTVPSTPSTPSTDSAVSGVTATPSPRATAPTAAPPANPTLTSNTTSSSTSDTTAPMPRVDIRFAINPAKAPPFWSFAPAAGVAAQTPAPPPTLQWDVVASSPVKVVVSGPEGDNPTDTLATTETGSHAVCPGTRTPARCSVAVRVTTTFTYTLRVFSPDGTAVGSPRTAVLTVVPG